MEQPHNASNHNTYAHRVIASLNREQIDYLDKVGKDAQFSSGTKLSRTDILAAMVNAIKRLHLTGTGISTATQFEERIYGALTRRKAGGKENGRPERRTDTREGL